MRRILMCALASSLALAACDRPADEESGPATDETAMPVEPDGGIGDGATPLAQDTAETSANAIPQSLRGRWGLVPADCTSTRGDAKGLLTVSSDTLRFYESVGTLGTIKERADDRIRADFAFTGEGMNWTRDVALTIEDGGRSLVRREYGEEASPGAFKYTRCS